MRVPRNRPIVGMKFLPDEEVKPFVESRINGGMVTAVDSADLETHQFPQVKNFFVRYDKTFRRYGTRLYTPVKPNSNKVLNIFPMKRFDGTVNILRFTPSSVHIGTSTTWALVTPAIALTGGVNNRFVSAIINDRFFFANGVDPVQEINFTASTHAVAGNASNYRFVTGFFNRLVGARTSTNPIQVGWSGDSNLAQFDPNVDISAGSTPLIDSPSDYADFITGLFGFSNAMLVLRERSIWQAVKIPSASNPFNFYTAVSGLGCDSPDTAVQIPNGIAWFDFRTGSVYTYKLGTPEPVAIGRSVEKEIVSDITDITTIFAGYNTVYDEYTLVVPIAGSTICKLWTYNFRTQAWWYEEMFDISALANIDYESSSLMIEDLPGMIEALVGTIESLTSNVAVASRFYGKTLGDLEVQDTSVSLDNGVAYTSELISKTFTLSGFDEYVAFLRIEYVPQSAGSFSVYYSKDGGISFTLYKTVTFTSLDYGKRKLATFKKQIKCRNYNWKIVSTAGLFDLLEYEGNVYQGAVSKAS